MAVYVAKRLKANMCENFHDIMLDYWKDYISIDGLCLPAPNLYPGSRDVRVRSSEGYFDRCTNMVTLHPLPEYSVSLALRVRSSEGYFDRQTNIVTLHPSPGITRRHSANSQRDGRHSIIIAISTH